jgi:hypothetical protein
VSIEKSLMQKYQEQTAQFATSVKKATAWFTKKLKTISGNEIMATDSARLVSRGQLGNRNIGRLVMFFYDPKHKKTLPYYDRFPLVIILNYYKDGFLGLNLHYLPINLRAKFLDGLEKIYKGKQLDENRKLNLTYKTVKSSSRTRYFKPCVKRYLYKAPNGGGVKSKFYIVDPEEWEMVLTLPTERFEKKSKEYVWQQSKKALGIQD